MIYFLLSTRFLWYILFFPFTYSPFIIIFKFVFISYNFQFYFKSYFVSFGTCIFLFFHVYFFYFSYIFYSTIFLSMVLWWYSLDEFFYSIIRLFSYYLSDNILNYHYSILGMFSDVFWIVHYGFWDVPWCTGFSIVYHVPYVVYFQYSKSTLKSSMVYVLLLVIIYGMFHNVFSIVHLVSMRCSIVYFKCLPSIHGIFDDII
jgi:hypothetical protein